MKKRSIRNTPNTEEETIVERILRIPRKEVQSYAAFCYLFGNRVSEGLGIPTTKIVGQYEYTKITKKGSKKILIPKKEVIRNSDGTTSYELDPLRAWQIEYDKKKNLLWCRSVPTLKTSGRPVRDVWAVIDGPGEEPLVKIVVFYAIKVREEKGETGILWEFTRNTAYHYFRKYLGINAFPHKLRDLRATKDATTYGLDAKDLMEKYNWSRPDMPMYYARKNREEIIGKMRKSHNNYTIPSNEEQNSQEQ